MSTAKLNEAVQTPGLYQPEFEHDNCGIGAVVNIKGVNPRNRRKCIKDSRKSRT